jgi:hypothetical protein
LRGNLSLNAKNDKLDMDVSRSKITSTLKFNHLSIQTWTCLHATKTFIKSHKKRTNEWASIFEWFEDATFVKYQRLPKSLLHPSLLMHTSPSLELWVSLIIYKLSHCLWYFFMGMFILIFVEVTPFVTIDNLSASSLEWNQNFGGGP